ncbi:MAG: hypothetical protein E3J72_01500 [Planctomycetota bacterium]|nr:MAG: hypothetical protein E3J72_01500 [Planctomycetota bacterium]
METRNTSFWFSPAGIMVALLLVVVVVLVGFLAYAPIARAWWIGRLTHDNQKMADEARERIRAMGDHAAGALCELLDSADRQKRREAALLLGELEYYDITLPFWIERLTSGNAEYAADAQDYLAGMGEKAITDIRLLLESSELRRRFAAYAVCIKMDRRDLAPMTLRMDYALDGAGFPRGSVAFWGLVDGEKYGDLVVVAATELANSAMNVPEDKGESYIEAARKAGFDALMRGQVIFFHNAGDIETFREIIPPPAAEPADEAGRAVWRRVKETVLSTGESKISKDRFTDVLAFIRKGCGVNVVVDPAAVDGRPVTIDVDLVTGDVFLDMLTLHRGLAWRIMGPAVVIFDPPGKKDRFTVSKGEFKNYPKIVKKPDAGAKHSFEFESASFQEALDKVESTADLTILPMPDVDLTKKVNLKIDNVSLRHALDYLVKVAAGYYWFVSDGAIVVSREKPPSEKIVSGRDFSASAGKFPEIAGHLVSRTVTGDFDGQDLTNVAKSLQERTGIHVFLHPDFHMEPPAVSVRVNERPLKDVLNNISLYVGCSWDVRYGGIFMASASELERIPKSIPIPVDLPGRIEAKLNGKISLNLDDTPLAEVVRRLAKDENVPIRIGKGAKRTGQENAIISCNLADLELRYALEAILLPVGLSWKLEKGEIVIVPQ